MDLISAYANGVSELPRFSHAPEQPPLIVDVIVNPHAGFFKRQSTVSRLIRELETKLDDLRRRLPRRKVEVNTVHFTERAGHAREITEGILAREQKERSGLERLLIGCGGDGTSNEICSALVLADAAVLDGVKLLRLPLGTGNDVADAPTFEDAYNLILGPQTTVRTGALAVRTATGPALYSFNVGSIGLDAYIAELTNRFKRAIPGDAYKLMVDAGSLFYERRVQPRPMQVTLEAGGKRTAVESFIPSMVIVGISGQRTYGGHMPVLPGADNVCLVAGMSFLEKLRNKKLFYEGRHGELPQVRFFRADTVEVGYDSTIPMQLDGELTWLTPESFPVTLSVLQPKINILRHING
jgi:diacylglycerol kinase family enzyme